MDKSFQFIIGIATAFATLSPGVFIAIREAVKRQRKEIITDLSEIFDTEKDCNLQPIPSFEFLKYKYFVGSERSSDPDPTGIESTRRAAGTLNPRGKREDFSTISWIIGCSAFSALAGSAVFYISTFVMYVFSTQMSNTSGLVWSGASYPIRTSFGIIWLSGICAAFTGSYLMSLRNLHRAVKNFDLNPGTIISETIKILIAIVLGPLIVISVFKIGSDVVHPLLRADIPGVASSAAVLVITACFVAGIMPDVALRFIIQRDQLKNFKQEENDVFQAFKITPVEIIDGIDSEIRSRLEDHHIHSTQNLAAANPLMLFVETPFGVYQIMDWVAQAQLCCSVGRDKIIRLWPLGIRTLFDLERLAERSGDENETLLIEVGRIILGPGLLPADLTDRASAAALVRRSIELRLDDPHVQRLRQIYIAVGDRLGSKSRRFRTGSYRILCRPRAQSAWTCRGMRAANA